MSDITERVREHFMYIMSSTWSIMNNKSQIFIYEQPGLVDYELVQCSRRSAPLYSWNLRDFIYDEARPTCPIAPIYPYSNGPSGSTTAFVLKLAHEEPQLGVRNTNETTLLLSSYPRETPVTVAASTPRVPALQEDAEITSTVYVGDHKHQALTKAQPQ